MHEESLNSVGRPDLDSVLADYMSRVDAGEQVDVQALFATYPDLADELRAYFSHAGALSRAADRCISDLAAEVTCGALEVRCPSCHMPLRVEIDTALTDLTCPSCGGQFSLIDQTRVMSTARPLSKVGRFELLERIGVGAFGSVWKARDEELDRTVAVKIPRQGAITAEEQEKFFREARAAAQLRHPNIVSVHEVGRDGDSVFIVSDLVRGSTLGDWRAGQQLTSREAAELCAKIADALHHAHEHGVVHRDLKPANVMIDAAGQPHLMDFGLARRDAGEVTVTLDGQVIGTPAYMSPEQAGGGAHAADRRSDVYSLGVILFQLLTGELPFRGNAAMMLHQVIHDDPPGLRKLNANVPRDLETITLKCLEKEPAQRYDTAQAVAAELRRWLAGDSILARPVNRAVQTWRWAKRNPRLAALTMSVALLLAAMAVISTFGRIAAQKAAARESELVEQARQTVDDFFTTVSQTRLLDASQLQPLRKELLQSAVEYYEDFAAQRPHDPQARHQLAAALFRVGTIEGEIGETNDAGDSIRRATRIWENLIEIGWEAPDLRANLASAYVNIAALGAGSNDPAAAIELCEKARNVWEALLRQYPTDADYRLSLARTLDQIADLQHRSGQIKQALQTYHEAEKEYRAAIEQTPQESALKRQLAVHLSDVAAVHAELGDRKMARDCLSEAATMLKHCIQANPSSLSSQRYYASVCFDLGQLSAMSGDFHEARKFLGQAAAIGEHIAAQNPANPTIQLEHAKTLIESARADAALSVPEESPESLARASRFLLDLASEGGWEPGARRSLAALLVDLASVGEFAGKYDLAVELLQGALQIEEQLRVKGPSTEQPNRRIAAILGKLALVQAASEMSSAYQSTCGRLLQEFGHSDDPNLCNLVAWACTLRPDGANDPNTLSALAQKAVAANPKDRSYLYTYGVAQFRAGHLDAAHDALQKAIRLAESGSKVADNLFLAMIYAATERIDEASRLLSSVEKEMDRGASGEKNHFAFDTQKVANDMECRLILSEAKHVIAARSDE